MTTIDHRQNAVSAIAALSAKFTQSQPAPNIPSFDTLYARVLSPSQLDAIAEIQEGILLIAQVEQRINLLAVGEQLNVSLFLTQTGVLWGRLQDRLAESANAAAKLHNGKRVAA